MKRLTKEELQNEEWGGRGGSTKVFKAIIALKVGEIILIEPEDWVNKKYPPTGVVRYIAKKYKRKFNSLRHAGGKGWAIERIS